jgi:hypothetical protein
MADALVKARKFADASKRVVATSTSALDSVQRSVEECLAALTGEEAQGKRIALQHKQAIAAADTSARGAFQRELAAHGQRLFRLRRVLMARWERVQVAWLSLDPAARSDRSATFDDLRARLAASLPRD